MLVCINKHDLNEENREAVEIFCAENGITVIGFIPFDSAVTKAMVAGLPVVEHASNSPASEAIINAWDRLKLRLRALK